MDKKIYTAVFFIIISILVSSFGIYIIYFSDGSGDHKDNKTTTTLTTTTTTTTNNLDDRTTTTTTTNIITTTTTTLDNKTTTKKTTSKKEKTTKKTTSTTSTTTSKKTSKNTSKSSSSKTTKKFALTIKEEKEETATYKYGTKISTIKYYEVTTYSNGEVTKDLIKTEVKYDKSSFKATTAELLSEAKSLASSNKTTASLVVSYVNDYRRDEGVQDITLNNELSILATIRALELAWSGGVHDISHTRPNGSKWSTVLKEGNYAYSQAGENVAAGYNSAKSVSEGWKNSSGHYENMVRSEFKQIGVGLAVVDGVRYWVQLFSN